MAQPIDLRALLEDPAIRDQIMNDPAKMQEFMQGYAQGEAIAETVQNTPMQPQVQGIEMTKDPKKMQQQMYALLQKSIGQQEQTIQKLRSAAEQERQRQEQMGALGRLDLRPFAQALRQYGSTTVAVPTEAPQDRTEILRKLNEELAQAEQGLTSSQVAFMRNLMQDRQAGQLAMSQENQELRIRNTVNTSEQAKKARNIGTLNKKLAGLEELVNKTGAELTGEEKAKLDSAFRDAEVAWKEAANLGALQGPDIEMIRGALGESPTSIKGIGRYTLSGGKEGLLSKIRGARERAVQEGMGHLENIRVTFPYSVAEPIYSDLEKKLKIQEAEAKPAVGMSEAQKKRLQELKAKYGK